ncbi:hypothetical protein LY76DRAFT_338506 [Colletotrichum caudatum]|nr:hypothetical protein LY76DRAFT_338506 [Colletotrichum caudatum]
MHQNRLSKPSPDQTSATHGKSNHHPLVAFPESLFPFPPWRPRTSPTTQSRPSLVAIDLLPSRHGLAGASPWPISSGSKSPIPNLRPPPRRSPWARHHLILPDLATIPASMMYLYTTTCAPLLLSLSLSLSFSLFLTGRHLARPSPLS